MGIRTDEWIVGLHPFSDEDPMGISSRFGGQSLSPLYVDRDAKSLVKHPLTASLSMRCGSLKDGVNDGFLAWSAPQSVRLEW